MVKTEGRKTVKKYPVSGSATVKTGSKRMAGVAPVGSAGEHKVTLREAFDIVVRKYGHALKELEKY